MDKETYSTLYDHALVLAAYFFTGKTDRAGHPMILHSLRVSLAGKTPEERIIGLLHDILEDTDCTEETLRQRFPDEIVDAVATLTRKPGSCEQYLNDYVIGRVMTNVLATAVKLNDIRDNYYRSDELPMQEAAWLRTRWKKAYSALIGHEASVPPNTYTIQE